MFLPPLEYNLDIPDFHVEWGHWKLTFEKFVVSSASPRAISCTFRLLNTHWGDGKFLRSEKGKVDVGLEFSKIPLLAKDADPQILDRFEGNERPILTGFSIRFESTRFLLLYSNEQMGEFMNLVWKPPSPEERANPPPQSPFRLQSQFTISFSEMRITSLVPDVPFVLHFPGFYFSMGSSGMDIKVSKLRMDSRAGIRKSLPLILSNEDVKDVISLTLNEIGSIYKIKSLTIFCDLELLMTICTLFLRCPFLHRDSDSPPPPPPPEGEVESQPAKTMTIALDQITLRFPVTIDPSDVDLFPTELDAAMVFGAEATRYTISSLSCYFEKIRGQKFDPLLDRINGTVTMSPSTLEVLFSPITFTFCSLDISALTVFYGTFMKQLSGCDFNVFQSPKKPSESQSEVPSRKYAIDFSELKFLLIHGRRFRLPFLRFGLGPVQSTFDLASASPSELRLSFDSFDLFNGKSQSWDMIIEPFRASIVLVFGENPRYEVFADEHLKIKCYNTAIHRIISWSRALGKNLRSGPTPTSSSSGVLHRQREWRTSHRQI
jgi:hypothetical protein